MDKRALKRHEITNLAFGVILVAFLAYLAWSSH